MGGVPVGFLTVEQDPLAGWIDQIGVVPAWRRHGPGAALLTEALHRFEAEGITEARLHVNVNNSRAAALFVRLGFRYDLRRGRYVKRRR